MANSGLGQRARALACLVGVAVVLAGCETGARSPNGAAGADAAPVAQRGKSGTRDVEAPEVFNVTDKGLWDGRPSLGGIWVAHSSVKTPERVIVRNAANGKSIEAALFRRERSNPGPALQLSDSAAAALGMLAGQPAELTVVALRRMEVAPEPETEAVATAAAAGTEAIDAKKLDPVAGAAPVAAATIAAISPGTKPAPKPADKAEEAAAAAAASGAAAPAKKRKWWQKREAPAPAAEAVAAVPDTAAAATAAATIALPFVQIGTFSREANARQASDGLRKDGVPSEVRKSNSGGKTIWRVIAGPAGTAAERNDIEKKVKALGYKDAYAVAG